MKPALGTVEVTRPFSVAPLLAYLRVRAVGDVEAVEDGAYRRSFGRGAGSGVLSVSFKNVDRLGVVTFSCSATGRRGVESSREAVAGLIDADAPVTEIQAVLESDPSIAALARLHPGIRIPGTVDPFELAVRAVLGQQVSVAAATTFASRLVREWGSTLAAPEAGITRAFPGPAELAEAPLEQVGLSRAKAEAIRHLASAVASERLQLTPSWQGGAADQETLQKLPGVGPWTGAYVALRALRDRDSMPIGDLGLRQALGCETGAEVAARAESWRPWRGYAAVHLWSTFLSIEPVRQ